MDAFKGRKVTDTGGLFLTQKKPGLSPRQSRWMVMRVAAPAHPVGTFIRVVRRQPSLAASMAIPGSRHPNFENDHPWPFS
jgi:hypothetical protein